VREWGLSEEITRLVLPPSDGTPPALPLHLRNLNWWLNKTNLTLLPKFLSPHLTSITITTNTRVRPDETVDPWNEQLPRKVVPKMRSAIKSFPSSLQCLYIQLGNGPETRLTKEISAFILGCGESLQEFSTNLVLSTQAIVRLMKLPNLRVWVTDQGPPQVTDLIHHGVPDGVTSLFPSLIILELKGEAALEWLSPFNTTNNGTPPWIIAGGNLPALIYRHPTLPMDSLLVSRLLPFAGLTEVFFDTECFMRPCVSKFTDQDVERLAIALPKLEALTMGGWLCNENTCPTTVRSLLSLSVHCTKLKYLGIHFRTDNLLTDMLDMLSYAYSQGLHPKPKCSLEALKVGQMLLNSADQNTALIAIGMHMIFPSLVKFTSMSRAWAKVEMMVKAMRQVGEPLKVVTENFMRTLNEVREQVKNGPPTRSAVSFRSVRTVSVIGSVRFIDTALCSFSQEEMAHIICEPFLAADLGSGLVGRSTETSTGRSMNPGP
jgi:hypothetical protein